MSTVTGGIHRLRRRLVKPAYYYNRGQIGRRASARLSAPEGYAVVDLPWGHPLEVDVREQVGASIARQGIFELAMTEAAFRLVDQGDTVIDVGANLGYFTSVLSAATGPAGTVVAFEPHPDVRALLRRNVDRWSAEVPTSPTVTVREEAVSNRTGTARLAVGDEFSTNRGTASLELDGGDVRSVVEVPTLRLADALGDGPVGLLKVDVEGHELAVFEGAARLLSSGAIRDILFEDHDAPSSRTRLLKEQGFVVVGLTERLRGLQVRSADDPRARPLWDSPTYIATRDPERLTRRLAPAGWRCLRRRRNRPVTLPRQSPPE